MWHLVRVNNKLRFFGNGQKYQTGNMIEVADGPYAAVAMSNLLALAGVFLTVDEIADEMEQI